METKYLALLSENPGEGTSEQTAYHFDKLNEAEQFFNEKLSEEYTRIGYTCLIELIEVELDEDEEYDEDRWFEYPYFILKDDVLESKKLSGKEVIVTYIKLPNGRFEIIDVRKAVEGEDISSLNSFDDVSFKAIDVVYEDMDSFIESVRCQSGIFGRISSGKDMIERFIEEH